MDFSNHLTWLLFSLWCGTALTQGEAPCWYDELYETPCYNIDYIAADESYQLRTYQSTVWVKTPDRYMTSGGRRTSPFRRLFGYISDHGIDMTSPVLMRHSVNGETDMRFLLPTGMQEYPEPSNANVQLDFDKSRKFYVRQFSGYAWFSSNWELETLQANLERDDRLGDIDGNLYFIAQYDSPYKIFNRRNEIWIPLKQN